MALTDNWINSQQIVPGASPSLKALMDEVQKAWRAGQISAEEAISRLAAGGLGPTSGQAVFTFWQTGKPQATQDGVVQQNPPGAAGQSQGASPGGGAGLATITDIIAAYKAGGYGAIGSQDAYYKAVQAMQAIWQSTGLPETEAKQRALGTMQQQFGQPSGAAGAAGAAGTGSVNDATAAAEYERAQSQTATGRQNLFKRFLASYVPDTASPYYRQALEQRQEGLSNAFLMERGLGGLDPEAGFSDYVRKYLGGISPYDYNALLARTRKALSLTGGTPAEALFREQLTEKPELQYQLALEGARPEVAGEFQDAQERLAARNFQSYRLAGGLGHLGLGSQTPSFLAYANQGGIQGSTAPNEFRNYATQAADLLTNPDAAGLGSQVGAFRKQLIDDPEEQYRIALEAGIGDVAGPFRSGYRSLARRAFLQYPGGGLEGNPFLSYIAKRGYRF